MALSNKPFCIFVSLVVCTLVSGLEGKKEKNWHNDEEDPTCEQMGGYCVDPLRYTCSQTIDDVDGCDDDEICCGGDFYHLALNDFENRIRCRKSRNCKRLGGYCYDPNVFQATCDFNNIKACKPDPCTCCVRCQKMKPQKSCKNYVGICAKECPDERVEVGSCKSGCKCCGCPTTNACSDYYGQCIPYNAICPGRMDSTKCLGSSCSCCMPFCPDSDECIAAGGKCDRQCPVGTIMSKTIPCIGEDCFCCLPKPPSCSNTTDCTNVAGYCDYSCHGDDKPIYGFCDGNCACCIPPDPCPDIDVCLRVDGKCRQACEEGEEPNPNVVCDSTGRCECCVKKPEPCRNATVCQAAGGNCKDKCDLNEQPNPDLCEKDCTCCIPHDPPCVNTTTCTGAGGYCGYSCQGDDKPTYGPCQGNCACCMPPGPCPDSDACLGVDGECKQTCEDGEEHKKDIICDSMNKCQCCVKKLEPCKNTTVCAEAGGTCKHGCELHEQPDDNSCEGNCTCCIPRKPDPCVTGVDCQGKGGSCKYHCDINEDRDPDLCTDDHCTCCIPHNQSCVNTTDCTRSGGYCGYSCQANDRPVYGLCQGNCVCCMPPDLCPNNDACLGVDGKCRDVCEDGEKPRSDVICDSTGSCQCCVRDHCQHQTEDCSQALGYCNATCPGHLLSRPDLCKEDCNCCLPDLTTSPCKEQTIDCVMHDGYCNETCPPHLVDRPDLCKGDCSCCTKATNNTCVQSDCCRAVQGTCNTLCSSWTETTVPSLCTGDNCVCCIRDSLCKQTNECTNIYSHMNVDIIGHCRQNCPSFFKSIPELCDDTQKCVCCIPPIPTTQKECQMFAGYCYWPYLHKSCTGQLFGTCEDGSQCCLGAASG